MGSVPNCQKEIPACHAIRWFKCKLKPPKNENGKAILYSQPTNPPRECDVYLCYSNEYYDSICSMKSSEECIGGITFNITQDDVNAFAAIGASFYVSDPMDVINGGKL